jgi:hypothetical protein
VLSKIFLFLHLLFAHSVSVTVSGEGSYLLLHETTLALAAIPNLHPQHEMMNLREGDILSYTIKVNVF